MTSDDAYRYVKSKRVTISPNFNFLGQLLEYEKQLRRDKILDIAPEPKSAPVLSNGQKRLCRTDMRSCHLSLKLPAPQAEGNPSGTTGDQSPTTALARLSFGNEETQAKKDSGQGWSFPRSMSCGHDWLSCQDDTQVENRHREGEQVVPTSRTTQLGRVRNPLHRIASEGAVVPHPLDTLPTMEEIETEASNDGREQASPTDITWKGIPISSLKELNFTPCQTSSSSSSSSASSSAAPSHETTPDPYDPSIGQEKTYTVQSYSLHKVTNKTLYLDEAACAKASYSTVMEKCQDDVKWSYDLQSPVSDTHVDFKLPDYQRSDSVCTSGLGSEEGSDLQGVSSVEDNCDEDCETQSNFQLRKNVCLASGHLLQLSLPLEKCTSSDPCDPLCDANTTETVRSPLSPSESHLLGDLPDEGAEETHESILECSQDSGILSSPTWPQTETTADSSFKLSKDEMLPRSHPGNPHVETCRKRKSQQWEDPPVSVGLDQSASSRPLLLSISGRGKSQQWDDSTTAVGTEPTTHCRPLLLSANSARGIPQKWEDPPVLIETESETFTRPMLLSTNSRDGLYRAQSCPGILSWFALTLEGSTASCGGMSAPFLRQKGSNDDRNVKCRNRNSCGSLDYSEYKPPLHQYSSCESCPEVIGECSEGLSSSGGRPRERRGTLSPSHRVFQQSRDMIQVS